MAKYKMSRHSHLNGTLITSATVSRYQPMVEINRYSMLAPIDAVLGYESYEIDVSLIFDGDDAPEFRLGEPLMGMGEGWICKHCQSYTPRGKYLCMNCQAPLTKQLIKPIRVPFMITEYSRTHHMNDFSTMKLAFRSTASVDYTFIYNLASEDMNIFSTDDFVDLKDGLFMCDYCGSITDGEQRCNVCDGKRLPFREVIDINHECLYCSNVTNNGIVCDSCGASMGGNVLADRMNIDSLSPFYED